MNNLTDSIYSLRYFPFELLLSTNKTRGTLQDVGLYDIGTVSFPEAQLSFCAGISLYHTQTISSPSVNKGRRDMSFIFSVYSVLPEEPDGVALGSAERRNRTNDRCILWWSVTRSIKDMSPNSSLYRLTFYAALHENTCNLQASIKN